MDQLAPLGQVYQAGTLSGNPVSVAAGLAGLRWLRDHDPYAALEAGTTAFADRLESLARSAGLALQMPRAGSLFAFFFSEGCPQGFDDVMRCDQGAFQTFFHALLERDVYLAPSPFECGFLSIAHDATVMDEALGAFEAAIEATAHSQVNAKGTCA